MRPAWHLWSNRARRSSSGERGDVKKASGYSHAVEAAAACFAVGVVTGWWLHAGGPVRPVRDVKAEPRVAAAPPAAPANAGASVGAAATASIGGGEGPPLTAATKRNGERHRDRRIAEAKFAAAAR